MDLSELAASVPDTPAGYMIIANTIRAEVEKCHKEAVKLNIKVKIKKWAASNDWLKVKESCEEIIKHIDPEDQEVKDILLKAYKVLKLGVPPELSKVENSQNIETAIKQS